METLLVLLGGAGRMVDKGDLMKAVWPDTFVEEGALTRNISLLRKALGDAGEEEASYIETIPKRGYRFVAPLRTSGGDTSKTLDWAWKAVGERSDYLIYLHVEPRVGKLAGNPEFIKMLGRLH